MTALLMDHSSLPSMQDVVDNEDLDDVIKLRLRKPKSWNWELSTSKSSPNISFPRILLYDDKGDLLADAAEADCVFKGSNCRRTQSAKTESTISASAQSQKLSSSTRRSRRSSTTNLKDVSECLENLVEHLKSNGIDYKLRQHGSRAGNNEQKQKRYGSTIPKTTEFEGSEYLNGNINEFNEGIHYDNSHNQFEKLSNNESLKSDKESPIWVYSERGLLQRDLNSKEFEHVRKRYRQSRTTNLENIQINENKDNNIPKKKSLTPGKEVRFDLQKSKSAIEVGEIGEKKKCRRTNSSGPSKFSGSILERMSAFKRRSSSTDSQDLDISLVSHGPRYFLRTSNAGTLVVCEESFRNRKVRRRPRVYSRISENDENELRCSQEKVTHKYSYPGTAQNYPHIDDITYNFDAEIAKIDNLISKASSVGSCKNIKKGKAVSNESSINNAVNARSKNNLLTVAFPSELRQQSVASDGKVKRRKKLKEIRRCASTGSVFHEISSDDDEKPIQVRTSRKSRDNLHRTSEQLKPLESFPSGDQILTLNNNLSAVQPIGSSADIIEEPSDEDLLRIVRHLASFNQNQHLNQEPESIKKVKDQNSHYRPQLRDSETRLEIDGEPLTANNNNYNLTSISAQQYKEASPGKYSNQELFDDCDVDKKIVQKGVKLSSNKYDNTLQNCHVNDSCQQSPHKLEKCVSNQNSLDNRSDSSHQGKQSAIPHEATEKFGISSDQTDLLAVPIMGSNVSRNSSKGLTGRRTQSSGNLCSDKRRNGSNFLTNDNRSEKGNRKVSGESRQNGSYGKSNHKQTTSDLCTSKLVPPICVVTQRDRNKFCGSLPNHLDTDNVESDLTSANYNLLSDATGSDQIEYMTVAPRRNQHSQPLQQQQQQSPYNNSINEKETASTSSGSSTFKINQDRPDIQLKIPFVRSNFDPSCDQGYGSERSPEDEIPPPMPNDLQSQDQLLPSPFGWDSDKCSMYASNFITKDCTFCVQIVKGPRGLGLSISGGIDSNAAFPGLIRIKRLFPHQAAWSTGQLQAGDIILEVNGVPLTGLTNYEALEVLRTMPNNVSLLICRPNDEQYKKLSPPTEPPKPPQRTQQQYTQTMPETCPLQPLTPIQTNFTGEFEIVMVKQQGSLGFTLRKEDESILGHYVRALVREPATTDGRIRPGDKIVTVNDVPLSAMTHEQAVIFLRQAADTVKLRLYRDEAQTPVAAMSPTNSEYKTVCGSLKKTFLRPEAINLLSDLAYKKQSPIPNSTESSVKSTNSSPRRLKRGNKPSNSGNASQSEHETTDSKSSSNPQYIVSSQTTSVCSDSEQSLASQCSYIVQPADVDDLELFQMSSNGEKPDRPSFLDLTGQSERTTPVASRKPRFQFTVAANAYELNNLNNEELDAPMYTVNNVTDPSSENQLAEKQEFTSLPCETFLIACKTESDLKKEGNFSYKNPMYQSAHVQVSQENDDMGPATKKDGNKSLLKWKGVVFSPEDEEKETPEADSSCAATAGTNPTPGTERDFDLKEFSSHTEGHKVLSVELNRGWNSRLGFSLQPDPATKKTIITAIYSDSVAAKDGRLRVGDQLLMVNEESVEHMTTAEIIDLLRIIRGSIVITVLRKNFNNQCWDTQVTATVS